MACKKQWGRATKILVWLALLAGCGSKSTAPKPRKPDLDRAKSLIRSGKLQEAEAIYRGLLAQDDTSANAWADLAYILCLRGDFGPAVRAANQAIQADPEMAEPHAALGLALFRTGGSEIQAVQELETAIRLNPRLAEAWNTLGAIYYARGDLEVARAKLEAAVGMSPRLPEALFNLALVYEALAQRKGRRGLPERNEALRSYGKFLALEAGPEKQRAAARQSAARLKQRIEQDER
jgi:Flp pilus assembly protein TadD